MVLKKVESECYYLTYNFKNAIEWIKKHMQTCQFSKLQQQYNSSLNFKTNFLECEFYRIENKIQIHDLNWW